jgi:hypothetical protein
MKERVAPNSVTNREEWPFGELQIGAVRGSMLG